MAFNPNNCVLVNGQYNSTAIRIFTYLNPTGETLTGANFVSSVNSLGIRNNDVFVVKGAAREEYYYVSSITDDRATLTVLDIDLSFMAVEADGATSYLLLSDLLGDWLTVRGFGAAVNGTTSDTAAFTSMFSAVGYSRAAPGTSLISSSMAFISPSNLIIGGSGKGTRLLGDNAIGNGIGLIRMVNATRATIDGLAISLPSTVNLLRGVQASGGTGNSDLFLTRLFIDALTNGTYGIAVLDTNIDRITIALCDFLCESYGILIKPNLTSPTSNTSQGKDYLLSTLRYRGQGPTGGTIGFSCDGNFQNVVIVGTQATDVLGSSEGFAWAAANDGANRAYGRGYLLMASGARNVAHQAIHLEDALRGHQVIGVTILDAERGMRSISTTQGFLQLGNHIGIFADGLQNEGISYEGAVQDGPEGLNTSFNLVRDWGKGTSTAAILLFGPKSNKVNILGNMLLDGAGDAIRPYADGLDGAGRGGGINIDYNHIEGNTGAALDPRSTAVNAKTRIGSGNTFRSTGGLLAATANLNNIIGDQRWVSDAFTAGAVQQDQVSIRAMRSGLLTAAYLVYETTNDSTVANSVQIHKFTAPATDTTMATFSAPTGTDAAFTNRSMASGFANNAARQFTSGDVLYVRKTNVGDGTYRFRVVLEYFEYFN